MVNSYKTYMILLLLMSVAMQGCIHEYHHNVNTPMPGNDGDPTTMDAFLEVAFDLKWETMIHSAEVNTKATARTEKPHRFIVEISQGGEKQFKDEVYLSDDEFSLGTISRKLSKPLKASYYQISVWYDIEDETGNRSFHTEDLGKVSIINFSTTDATVMQCAYASEILDLTGYEGSKDESVNVELELQHPGARFEIVATDVQQFITNNKEALNQGDKYTVNLTFSYGAFSAFNLYSHSVSYESNELEMSGRMRLPFAEYDELKIAEGFIFCEEEADVSLRLNVTNTALFIVSSPPSFSFPVKRGCVTIVSGDFLTSSLDGVFDIDHIWEGEIVIEV